MRLTGYKPGPLIYSSVTTAWTTFSTGYDAVGFYLQAQTSSLLFRVDTATPPSATAEGAGIFLRGSVYDDVELYGKDLFKNLKVACETSGSTVHCYLQLFYES